MGVRTQLHVKLVPKLVRVGGRALGVRGRRGCSLLSGGAEGPSSPKSLKKTVLLPFDIFFIIFWAAGNSSGFGMQLVLVCGEVGTEGFVCSSFLHSFLSLVTFQSCTST